MANTKKRELLILARVAESAYRYEEMLEFCIQFIKLDPKLTFEERDTFSVAFKNSIETRRSSIRILLNIELKEEKKKSEKNAELAKIYINKLLDEIKEMCEKMIKLIDDYLMPAAQDDKYQGDYYRYIGEFLQEEGRESYGGKAREVYEEAQQKAMNTFTATDPIRIGLALNFSILYYEILNDHLSASAIAKGAFDDAINNLDHVNDISYKDATVLMQVLRDNMTLWNSEHPSLEDADQ